MNRFHVVLIDDEANSSAGNEFAEAIITTLTSIDSRFEVAIEPISNFHDGLAALKDLDRSIQLAVLDVRWPVSAIPGADSIGADHARPLLQASLARPDTATLLVSKVQGSLIPYLYDERLRDIRPHAVFDKSMQLNVDAFGGAITGAFSNAALRLRSRIGESDWMSANHRMDLPDENAMLAATEMVRMLLNFPVDRIELQPIGGGLSGSVTLAVSAHRAYGRGVAQVFLKMDRSARAATREFQAHEIFVPVLPANTFARLRSGPGVREFNGFYGVLLDYVQGSTAAGCEARVLNPELWNRIFNTTLFQTQANSAKARISSLHDLMTTLDGQLGGTRLQRVRAEGAMLNISGDVSGFLAMDFSGILQTVSARHWVTVQHGDLHTRNVLVGPEGQAYFIDAASMTDSGLWCMDLARFVVWTALGLGEGIRPSAEELAHAVLGVPNEAAPNSSADLIERAVRTSLNNATGSYRACGKPLEDLENEWKAALIAEFLRATYSREWFDSRTRGLAAHTARQLWAYPDPRSA